MFQVLTFAPFKVAAPMVRISESGAKVFDA
jgi:hypothetical protein